MQTVRLTIKGKVQGVFYRASAREAADESGVKGWVKNNDDGTVQALASGTAEQLEKFTTWCKKGPKRAVVAEVQVEQLEYQSFPDFRIIK